MGRWACGGGRVMLAFGNDTLSEPGGAEIRPARREKSKRCIVLLNISEAGALDPRAEVLRGQVVNFPTKARR